jgi:ABC-2 type transport system ATP-binding protein
MEPAIVLENLSKAFGRRQALQGVSFTVERGDIFGYLGSNGAGKTTSIRILLDLIRADSGRALILGRETALKLTRRNVGFVLDADGLYNNMTARENLEFYARLYGVTDAGPRMDLLIKQVGLEERADDRVGAFSKGMRQRLALARALVHDPELLILDEPMSGVDPSGRMELRQIMLDIVHNRGKTIFLSSHELDEVQRSCNRIALIHKGEIKLCGDLAALMRERGDERISVQMAQALPDSRLAEIRAASGLGFQEQDGNRLFFAAQARIPEIVGFLAERGIEILGVQKNQASLEELYAAILREEERTA